MSGRVVSLNLSKKKNVGKEPQDEVMLRPDWGVVGDAHTGPGDRQVSLLAEESIARFNKEVVCPKVGKKGEALRPGDFAENITTSGIDLTALQIGERLRIGRVELQISKIGKGCHYHCAIYKRLGDCIMPREGIFAKVVSGGRIKKGDKIALSDASSRLYR